MNNYNFEGQPDGDWDDRGDLSWQEYDWQQYLARHEDEVEKFIDVYNRLKDKPDHIDEVAHQMGWDAEDWSVADTDEDDFLSEDESDEDESSEDFDPYTVLRHPVYIVVRGLYRYMRRMWSHALMNGSIQSDAKASWAFAQMLGEGETHATLGLQSLDMGDFQLAVCQIKLALEAVNRTFTILPVLMGGRSPAEQLMVEEIRVRLFDLREVCLRVMNDCREELRRRGQGKGE
ncbi:MAG TPA: hypothetical protein PKI32_01215 [Opitutales bacterium]|nr:hypothetical protein [Opitutales bacterium]